MATRAVRNARKAAALKAKNRWHAYQPPAKYVRVESLATGMDHLIAVVYYGDDGEQGEGRGWVCPFLKRLTKRKIKFWHTQTLKGLRVVEASEAGALLALGDKQVQVTRAAAGSTLYLTPEGEYCGFYRLGCVG